MWQILLHKAFFPLFYPKYTSWLSLTTWGRSRAFFPLKCKATQGRSYACLVKVHPSPASSQNMQHYPSPQILSHLEWFFPLQNAKPLQILLYKFFFISLFFMLFYLSRYIYLSIYLFIIISYEFSFHFSPKLGILPQSWKIIPQHLGRIIEE